MRLSRDSRINQKIHMTEELDRLAKLIMVDGRREDVVANLLRVLEPPRLSSYSATWHPLGFLVVRLGLATSGQLRLHIWISAERPIQLPNWPIHTHMFELHSHILVGTVTNEWYDVRSGPSGRSRLYEVGYEGTSSTMKATPAYVDCLQSLRESFVPGNRYVVDRNQYHATNVTDGIFAATIVVAASPIQTPPMVVGSRDGLGVYTYDRQECSVGKLKPIVAELTSQM